MIGSYIASINNKAGTNALRFLIFNADTLRAYLNDTARGTIVTLKLMVAHYISYIDAGNYGIAAELDARALTIVIVRLNAGSRYIYNPNNMVYDSLLPCPFYCRGTNFLTHDF